MARRSCPGCAARAKPNAEDLIRGILGGASSIPESAVRPSGKGLSMSSETEATELDQRRLAIVGEHMESENRHEFDVTMATFDHPRYEIIPTGEIFDGPEEVAGYFQTTRAAFPDQR